MQMNRAEVVAQNPKARVGEIIQRLAKQWETVDPKLKQKLEEEYRKEQRLFVEKRAVYDSQVTDEQKEVLKIARQDIRESKMKAEYRKRVRELGKPKRPGSPFTRFMSETKDQYPRGNLSYKEWQLKMAENWSKLGDAEKSKFTDATKKEYEVYKVKMQKWEDEMLKLGNNDVVRNDSLVEIPETKPRSAKYVKK